MSKSASRAYGEAARRSRDWKEAKLGRSHSVMLAAIADIMVYGCVRPHGLTFVD